EDRCRALVAPVVEDRREDVDVAVRDAVEEVAGDNGAAGAAQRVLIADRLRPVEDDSAQSRAPGAERGEERPVAAADVDDDLVAAPAGRREPVDPPLLPLLHSAVERCTFGRVLGEPRPE